MAVLDTDLHFIQCVAYIGGVQLIDCYGLRIVALDCHDRNSPFSVVVIKLLNPAFIHLGDWAMVAGENHNEDGAAGVVVEFMNHSVHAGKREIGSGRAQWKDGVSWLAPSG